MAFLLFPADLQVKALRRLSNWQRRAISCREMLSIFLPSRQFFWRISALCGSLVVTDDDGHPNPAFRFCQTRVDGKLTISGSTSLKMTSFGIDPPAPKVALGMIKTGDEVNISFRWMVQSKL